MDLEASVLRVVGLRGAARDSGLYVAFLGDFLLQVVVDALDLVRPSLETLGYSDH